MLFKVYLKCEKCFISSKIGAVSKTLCTYLEQETV